MEKEGVKVMILNSIPLGSYLANCYILKDEKSGEALIIDPGFYTPRLEKFIEDCGVETFKYILCTHGHMDHIGGVPYVKEKFGGEIVIGKADRWLLKEYHFIDGETEYEKVFKPSEADILADNETVLPFGDTKITMINTPGHIAGSMCFFIDDMLFTGDLLFKDGIGNTNLEGGNIFAIIKSLRILKELEDDYRVFPGHGEATTLSREKRENRFFGAVR